MNTKATPIYSKTSSYFISSQNIITEVGYGFLQLTGYSTDELISKNIFEIFTRLLRAQNGKIKHNNFNEKFECYLFTKSYDVIEVTIILSQELDNTIKFLFKEKSFDSFEKKFPVIEQLFADNKIGIAIHSSPDLLLLKANQKYLDFQDFPFNSIDKSIGKQFKERVNGFEGSKAEFVFEEIIRTGKPYYPEEFEYEHFSRGVTYWDSSIVPVFEKGKVKYIIEIVSEVTQRVLNRKLIQEQEQIIRQKNELLEHQNAQLMNKNKQLEAIVNNISDVIAIFDKDGNYISLNNTIHSIDSIINPKKKTGYAFREGVYFDKDDNEITRDKYPITRILNGETLKKERIVMKSSEGTFYFNISGTPVYDDNGNYLLGVACNSDLTEEIRNKQIVEEQKEQLSAIIENMSDALFVFGNDGQFIALNKGARSYLSHINNAVNIRDGYSSYTFYNMDGTKIPFEQMPSVMVLNGKLVTDRHMKMKNEFRETYVSVNGTPIYDNNGNLNLGVVSYRDISEHIQADRMKDDFLSIISHELRTPLSVIISAIQAMEFICKNELTDKAKGYIGKIRQNSLRQLRLINNLLDITRINSGYIKIIKKNHDIVYHTKIIIESVYSYSQQKEINLSFKSGFAKKVIGFDEEKFERILLNLLSNAIKFTPMGKKILVSLSCHKGFVRIKVADEGIGIPKDKQSLIFERFGQVDSSLSRQAEGTGIGLSLVKMLVEALGGSITVKSKVGAGSIFTVLLPNEKIKEDSEEKNLKELTDNRLIQATASEFSDIYLH